ncbi:MAG: hypothetical protein NCW75_10530 [Phycisphaera sp.]|nr:MAG: hypothetical protein NCW75_10530 [Phycisphaera sp.]
MASRHEDIPSELHDVADQVRALPSDAADGLEARTFEASVAALREEPEGGGVVGRIGFARWMAPVAAAAVVGLLAWAGAAWLVPPTTTSVDPNPVSTVALDDHVSDILEYADLFTDSSWSETLAEDVEELDDAWEPTIESWSIDGELGAG